METYDGVRFAETSDRNISMSLRRTSSQPVRRAALACRARARADPEVDRDGAGGQIPYGIPRAQDSRRGAKGSGKSGTIGATELVTGAQ